MPIVPSNPVHDYYSPIHRGPLAITPSAVQRNGWQQAEDGFVWHCQLRAADTWLIRQHPRIAQAKSRQGVRMWGPDVETASNWDGEETYRAFDVKSQSCQRIGRASMNYTINTDALAGMHRFALMYQVPDEAMFFAFMQINGGVPYIAGLKEVKDAPIEYGDHAYYCVNVIEMGLRTLDFLLGPANPQGLSYPQAG